MKTILYCDVQQEMKIILHQWNNIDLLSYPASGLGNQDIFNLFCKTYFQLFFYPSPTPTYPLSLTPEILGPPLCVPCTSSTLNYVYIVTQPQPSQTDQITTSVMGDLSILTRPISKDKDQILHHHGLFKAIYIKKKYMMFKQP